MPEQATGQTPETTATTVTTGQPQAGGEDLIVVDELDALIKAIEQDPRKAAHTMKKLTSENAKRRKLGEELATLRQQAEAEAETKRKAEEAALKEQGKWKEIADQREAELAMLRQQAGRLTPYEAAIKDTLERRKAAMPEALRKRIPDYGDPIRELSYIEANPDLFTEGRTAPDFNQRQGSTGGDVDKAALAEKVRTGFKQMIGR